MHYNESPPKNIVERVFLDGLLHEYLIAIFYRSDIERWMDDISDRNTVTEHGKEELEEFNKSLSLIRQNIELVKMVFTNNAFRKR